jgi:hypothetical protein
MMPNLLPTLHCGPFDAETIWRDETLAKLPSLPDSQMRKIVLAMDELLFLFCRSSDVLLTRYPMDPAHLEYTRELGFHFTNIQHLSTRHEFTSSDELNMFKLWQAADTTMEPLPLQEKLTLDPFAVIDGIHEFAAQYAIHNRLPDLSVIRQVNSKLYSTRLKEKLGIDRNSRVVHSHAELKSAALELLASGPLLIKDTFGVSGKGNLLVASEHVLQRITTYIASQEQQGKAVLFIIEPLLDKKEDFSCQFHIAPDGSFEWISVQQVMNNDFAYIGSISATPKLLEKLTQTGYFELMKRVAEELYTDGYHGHVCVDSMLLQDGSMIPIVEINARKSMSLIKHQLDEYLDLLTTNSAQGNLIHQSVVSSGIVPFEDVLNAMDREELLYRSGSDSGIILLSANTLTINQLPSSRRKGRLYMSLVSQNPGEREMLADRMKKLLIAFGMTT